MEALDGLFRDPDTVYNVVSKAILSEQAKVDILNHNYWKWHVCEI